MEEAELDVEPGSVLEVASLKELGAFLGRKEVGGLGRWWRVWMGFVRDGDGE